MIYTHRRASFMVSGPAWTPASLTGLHAWYRAQDDPAGYADGAAVGTWTNRASPGVRNLTAAGAARPTFKTAISNGKAALLFDGIDDMLSESVTALSQPITILSITRPLSAVLEFHVVDGNSANRVNLGLISPSGAGPRLFAGVTVHTGVGIGATDLVISGVANEASSTIRVNRTSYALGASIGTNTLGGIIVGRRQSAAAYSNGYFYELAICSGALSVAELIKWEDYCLAQYGF